MEDHEVELIPFHGIHSMEDHGRPGIGRGGRAGEYWGAAPRGAMELERVR